VQKSVDELSLKQGSTSDKIADIQSRLAQHDLRLNAIDAAQLRMNDRIRLAEHQPPLHPELVQ
jgi:hypothetical protein